MKRPARFWRQAITQAKRVAEADRSDPFAGRRVLSRIAAGSAHPGDYEVQDVACKRRHPMTGAVYTVKVPVLRATP